MKWLDGPRVAWRDYEATREPDGLGRDGVVRVIWSKGELLWFLVECDDGHLRRVIAHHCATEEV